MKPEELMIGDWVYDKHYNGDIEPIKIYNIYGTEVNCKTERNRFDVDEIVSGTYISDLQPIPLTLEILEKNGFVKYNEVSDTPPYDQDEEGNMYYSYKGEQKFWGWWQPNNVYLIPVNAMVDLEIEYVHELQHALKLCGIDKPIIV